MKIPDMLARLLFPPKCLLCRKPLTKNQQDLCPRCRVETPEYSSHHFSIPFVAQWQAMWYYEGSVRRSLLRYKFGNRPSYAHGYGRLLAAALSDMPFDLITAVPISARRKRKRGYDQVSLLACALGKELGETPLPLLRKVRDNPAQSGISGYAQRKANVLGVYQVISPELLIGKRVLLLDDIITTGATVSECARVLLTAGAKEVVCAAIAARRQSKIQ